MALPPSFPDDPHAILDPSIRAMIRGCVVTVLAGVLAGTSVGLVPPSAPGPTPVEVVGLHNVFRVTPQLYSGSGPDNPRAFAALATLGIKTVISVDGARPNVEAAKAAGLHYIHVPIGYSGVPRERVVQLARAMKDLPGPFYIHCHHGKHRGPAATAIAHLCADDKCTSADALNLLRQAGTDPRYLGLFASVEKLVRPTAAEVRESTPLAEAVRVAGFTEAMVALDHHFDNLKLVRKAGWQTPRDHPDIEPAHEALQLLELYRESRRLPAIMTKPADFQDRLRAGETAVRDLEQVLRQAKLTKKHDGPAVEKTFARADAVCNACHAKYRD